MSRRFSSNNPFKDSEASMDGSATTGDSRNSSANYSQNSSMNAPTTNDTTASPMYNQHSQHSQHSQQHYHHHPTPPAAPHLQPPPARRQSSRKRDIRPISNLPVDDAFDYSGYKFDTDSVATANTVQSGDDNYRDSITKTPGIQQQGFEFEQIDTSNNHHQQQQRYRENEGDRLKNYGSLQRRASTNSQSQHTLSFPNSASSSRHASGLSPGVTQQRHISFAPSIMESPKAESFPMHISSPLPTTDMKKSTAAFTTFEVPEDDNNDNNNGLTRVKTDIDDKLMQRHRWGTQRQKNGRKHVTPKRSKSLFKSRRVSSSVAHSNSLSQKGSVKRPITPPSPNPHDDNDQDVGGSEPRKIYVNMPLPPDMVDEESGNPIMEYARNKVRTTKYTPLSFIPKNLFNQFKNVANIYFLFIVILGAFPIFGVNDPGLAAVPIIVIITVTAVKDAVEDYRRTVLDMELNNTPTQILAYNHNYNVTDENISLWRRFKKANTRLVIRIGRALKNRNKKKQMKKRGEFEMQHKSSTEDAFGHELTRAMTINSIYTVHDDYDNDDDDEINLTDLSNARPQNPFEPEGYEDEYNLDPPPRGGASSRPAQSRQASGMTAKTVDSVIDERSQAPGKAKFRRDFWKNVRVGDFVRIRNNDEIPADLVILATSDADGACYVETKNLDGETNLKVRQALKCGEGIKHALDCERTKFWIESEGPQPNLYTYNGVAKWNNGESSEAISINNVLLRGCALRNTDWVIGIALFSGAETKIMLNSGVTPTKRSQISQELNISVIANFALLFILCITSGIINGIIFGKSKTSIDYFEFGSIGGSAPVDGLVTFWAAVVLYQSLVPISLYISIEIVKTIQAFFIYSDCYMYYEPIDYPCTPKSWNISDDLGQIEYIFSDKTGTLTQNVMEFKKCTINGMAYGKAYTEAMAGLRKREGANVDEEGEQMREEIARDKKLMIRDLRAIDDNAQMIDDEVTFVSSQFVSDMNGKSGEEQEQACKHFMLVLALCHSVITEPSKKVPGRMDFKAQSPDEAALVATARDLGFTFVERTQKGVILNIQGEEQEYQILNTLEFNSTRKRMSAIVKFKSGDDYKIFLVCKGADSIIYSRLRAGEQELLRQETALHLEQFAQEGLRTLCLAQREISPEQYLEWAARHEAASSALVNREEKMEEVADSLERELTLLGGTAIEDRLQDGVPQAISLLGDAGIKLWVLTGDKVETAINIGFSCNLLNNGMELLVLRVDDNSLASTDKLLTDYLQKYFGMQGTLDEVERAKSDHSPPSDKYAFIIDGDTLKLALDDEIKHKLLLLCKQCKSVLCCRVSPAQKAAVVRLVKNTLGVMTLSIGDGANDVAMIQEAQVGVGIAGEEGRQAVMSSDYAIGQFRFLTRLVLVHGRWSYKRLAEMIPNFFYKNVVFTMALYWYGIFSSFDGAYLFEYTYVMFFNLAFTSLPVIFMGFLDQDVDDRLSLAVPQLYRRGILRMEWSQRKFWIYMLDGFYQSVISFFFPYFCYWQGMFEDANGRPLNHRFWIGLAVCSISVISCNIYVLSNQFRWDWISVLINFVSILLVYIWTLIYSAFVASGEIYGLGREMLGSCIYWAVLFVGIVACLLPHYGYLAVQKVFYPLDVDIIREKWLLGDYDSVPSADEVEDKFMPQSPSTQSSSSSKRKHPSSQDEEGLVQAPTNTSLRYPDSVFDYDDGASQNSMYGSRPMPYDSDGFASVVPTTSSTGRHRASLDFQPHNHHQRNGSSLEQVRAGLRMEQPLPRQSLDGVRTSMELQGVTRAQGLMRMSGEYKTRM